MEGEGDVWRCEGDVWKDEGDVWMVRVMCERMKVMCVPVNMFFCVCGCYEQAALVLVSANILSMSHELSSDLNVYVCMCVFLRVCVCVPVNKYMFCVCV